MQTLKKTILFCICFILVYKFCLQATDGFSVRKISSSPSTAQEKQQTIPNGPYHYLGKGAQVYAFVSEDGKHVLKFYRQNRAGHPLFFLKTLLPSKLGNRLLATVEKRRAKRLKDFTSFTLAERFLKQETGLETLHLEATRSPLWIVLYDKIGIKHTLDLSQMQWLLQEYAEPTYTSLKSWIQQGREEEAKAQLSKLVALLKSRCEKKIFDKDPDLETNFGFTKDGPIQFDVGRFRVDPTRSSPDVYRSDIIRITDKLCSWLDKRAPSLSTHVREEIEKL
ncbi:MAG: hypothetical protein P0S96_04530 [Simkaniaceae bacterium]|nr:hypothetical protein [Candidatus Sacchlamyda saccharinae]